MLFHDLKFCCTGIPTIYRLEIEQFLNELNGIYYSDLVADVEYLIVGNRNTEKFKFCIKNRDDITYLKFNSIHTIYNLYKSYKPDSGKEFKIDLNDYKLDTFELLNICLSSHINNDDIFHHEDLNIKLLLNNDSFSKSLTIGSSCLITNDKSGKRYEKAVEWKIPIIHPIYISHSITRGIALDVYDYLLEKYPDYPQAMEAPLTRKNILTIAGNPKLPNSSSGTGDNVPDTVNNNDGKKLKRGKVDVWDSIMNSKSIDIKLPNEPVLEKSEGIFKNLRFKLLNFNPDQVKILKDIITKHQGIITNDNDQRCDFKLIPFGTDSSTITKQNGDVRTEWLIERSIFYNRLTIDIWSLPHHPTSQSKNMTVSLSGFTGVEDLHIKQLLSLKGFTVSPKFNSKTNALLVNINILNNQLPASLFQFDESVIKCPYNSINTVSTKNKIIAAKAWGVTIILSRYGFDQGEINDPKWCLYYKPSKTIPKSNDEKLMSSESLISLESFGDSTDSLKLPSPKKIKRKFGKLVTNDEKIKGVENEGIVDDWDVDLGIGYGKKSKRL